MTVIKHPGWNECISGKITRCDFLKQAVIYNEDGSITVIPTNRLNVDPDHGNKFNNH